MVVKYDPTTMTLKDYFKAVKDDVEKNKKRYYNILFIIGIIWLMVMSFCAGTLTKGILLTRYNYTIIQNQCNEYIIENFYNNNSKQVYNLPFDYKNTP